MSTVISGSVEGRTQRHSISTGGVPINVHCAACASRSDLYRGVDGLYCGCCIEAYRPPETPEEAQGEEETP